MAKIQTYSIDEAVSNQDRVVGTDGKTGETKNFLLSDVLDIVQSNTTIVNFRNSNGNRVESLVSDDYAFAEHTYTIPAEVASPGDIFKFEVDFTVENADSTTLPLVNLVFSFFGDFAFNSFLPTGPSSADDASIKVSGTLLVTSASSISMLVDVSAASIVENVFQFKPALLTSTAPVSLSSPYEASLGIEWDSAGAVLSVAVESSFLYKI